MSPVRCGRALLLELIAGETIPESQIATFLDVRKEVEKASVDIVLEGVEKKTSVSAMLGSPPPPEANIPF